MDLLLDAVLLLLERESNFKVNIYGEMSNQLVDRVKMNERLNSAVILHGYTKNARLKLNQAHAYIQPTLAPGEGFGNAVAEAMGFGLPVITSNVGAVLELVVNKETGLLFEADNAASLAASMAAIMTMPVEQRKLMGDQGQKRLLQHFSLDCSVAAYSELFISLLKK
jgi:glycosyltransferase involved in cell wall biosynthesis